MIFLFHQILINYPGHHKEGLYFIRTPCYLCTLSSILAIVLFLMGITTVISFFK